MFIPLGTSKQYLIRDLKDYRGFLRGVTLLVQSDDVLAISSWGAPEHGRMHQDIRGFFESHQLQPDEIILSERKCLKLYEEEFPHAFAVLWPADPQLIKQLRDMLRDSTISTDLCTHILGYGPRGALFSFHDAFGGDLLISTRVPETQVEEFCRLLNIPFEISTLQPCELDS